jgi:hypothetical protein
MVEPELDVWEKERGEKEIGNVNVPKSTRRRGVSRMILLIGGLGTNRGQLSVEKAEV